MSNERTVARDDVVVEIKNKAREDVEFTRMLFANPQEAFGQFGFVIPGSSGDGKTYLESVYAMFARAEFCQWFHTEILNEFRDKAIATAPGPCVTAIEHEDVDWDFEVTTY